MGLEQLMDGALCTGVLVEADADTVAQALGQPRASGEGGPPLAFVAEIGAIGWCRVEYTAEVARTERCHDSDPLLVEALNAMNETWAEGLVGVDTPIRAARRLSEQLGVGAIGIWGSDQGPGIGGGVRFDAGQRSWCYSAGSPEDIELIDRVRDVEEQEEGELSRELEEALETLDDRSWQQTWSVSGTLEGDVSLHVDKELEGLGMDPDWIEEPLWAIAGATTQPDEVTRFVWVDASGA